ncbi:MULTISPECIES: DUF4307 domain-containing protein [unclassified Micromonospora]|uniref:DUF4307 domain-containing protein n=1 Tax=unclassified Micromonospora TaxID=2617518 RepID=UPI001044DFE3|nr:MULTISPECIES: DUF4307 domain-containing protein [unclassified Micromonospora]TDB80122.1 DUF4307 domain-containing protein [Micromonospora sp. KC721]TDC40715.1 DUF4307 domain-containing protein [Micromonospora sp. KC213]
MTETHATVPPGTPVFPPGRYGRRREPRRRRPLLAGLLVAGLAGVLVLAASQLYTRYGDPNYDAQMITYADLTDTGVRVDFRVTVPAGGSAVCLLRARSHDGAEVGREEVPVSAAPGERHLVVRHRVPTTARPFIGEVLRCRPVG